MTQKFTDKWKSISKTINLSETVIRKNQNNVYWPYIAQYQKLSTDFWTEFIEKVEDNDLWDLLAKYQDIGSDQTFVTTHAANFDWDILLKYNCITERYKPDVFLKIQSVITGPINFFYVLKSEFPENYDPDDTTSLEIIGNNISGNNKVYTLLTVANDETYYVFSSATSYTTAGVTKIGYLKLIGTGSGESTSDFLDNVTIAPYLHESNSLTKPFRKSLFQGNTLSEQWIVDNDTYINFDYLTRYCPLSEYFVMKYDNNSTVTGSVPSYDLNWEYLMINHHFRYLITEESSWTSNLINYYLALKYQNIPASFILNNQTLFNLTKVGLHNKNLSEQDLIDIAEANPWLPETTERPPKIKFDYRKSEILEDLSEQEFEIDSNYAIGYVKYLRSGSPTNEIGLNFDQEAGTVLSVPQLDLDQDNPNGRIGITVENGKNLLNDDRMAFKVAKIKTQIIDRLTNTMASGTIQTPINSLIQNEDIIVVNDGDNEFWFEFIKPKTTKTPLVVRSNVFFNRFEPEHQDHDFEHLDRVILLDEYETPFFIINDGDGFLYKADTKYRAYKDISTSVTQSEKQFISHSVSYNYYQFQTMRKMCIINSAGTTDTTENTITLSDDLRLDTGDPIRFTGTLPTPLLANTTYFAVVVDSTTIKVASSIENAISNQVIDITTSGSSYKVLRWDSTFVLLEDANLKTGQKINFLSNDATYASIPTGISSSDDYYVYKINDREFKVAETKSKLEQEDFVSITAMSKEFCEIQTINIPVILSEEVKTAPDVAEVLARLIQNIQIHKVTAAEFINYQDYLGSIDYRTIKTFKSSVSATVTDYLTTATSIDLETNRIHLLSDIGIQTGDPITLTCSSTYPVYNWIGLPSQSVGTGLKDLIASGSYTGSTVVTYTIKISTTGTPDQFQVKKGAGSFGTAQNITGELQSIGDGIYIQFLATTGHTLNNEFQIIAGRSLPASAGIESIFYAKRITTNQIELYNSLYDLQRGNYIDFVSTYAGTLTVYPCSLTIAENIDFVTGDTVIFDNDGDLSTNLTDGVRYFVNKVGSKKFFLSTYTTGYLNGLPKTLKSKGTGTFTLSFDDVNITSDTSSGTGKILGYNPNGTGTLFLEKLTDSFEENDDLLIEPDPDTIGVIASTTLITSEFECTTNSDQINITNNRSIDTASEGNQPILLYSDYFRSKGISNGYEDSITEEQSKGVGVVLTNGKLRAFSVEIIDPDWFDKLNY